MLRHLRDCAALADAARRWLTGPVRRRKKALILAAALALAGPGSATAATIGIRPPGGTAQHASLTADQRAAARREAKRPATTSPASKPTRPAAVPDWNKVRELVSWQTRRTAARPSQPPLTARLEPVGTLGPQSWMPISGPQLANATTIVQQALARQMGVRSAVIAVATAMQESRLQNLGYSDGDSLGLFQQQPWCGWGTAQQIMDPTFAADAFLTAMQQYQTGDPGWAGQPLWQTAQGVQKSGFPLAYAQWESQAANLVGQIAVGLQH